jgi:hypothetical protein
MKSNTFSYNKILPKDLDRSGEYKNMFYSYISTYSRLVMAPFCFGIGSSISISPEVESSYFMVKINIVVHSGINDVM